MYAGNFVKIADVTVDVGAADRRYYFSAPFSYELQEVHLSADTCNTTDFFSVRLLRDSTLIFTSQNITTPNVIHREVVRENRFIPRNSTLQMLVDFSGTAANVTGVTVSVWGAPKR